ncbi:unnamed protein product, partial [Prorocentrum cordatum]
MLLRRPSAKHAADMSTKSSCPLERTPKPRMAKPPRRRRRRQRRPCLRTNLSSSRRDFDPTVILDKSVTTGAVLLGKGTGGGSDANTLIPFISVPFPWLLLPSLIRYCSESCFMRLFSLCFLLFPTRFGSLATAVAVGTSGTSWKQVARNKASNAFSTQRRSTQPRTSIPRCGGAAQANTKSAASGRSGGASQRSMAAQLDPKRRL